VTGKVVVVPRPGRRALGRFRHMLEWMQAAAVLPLAFCVGAVLLV
jgi:hypothetical protein